MLHAVNTRASLTVTLVALATLTATGNRVRRRLMVVTVRGSSMEPAFSAGDRVLVCRTTSFAPGDVVVLTPPPEAEHVPGGTSSDEGEWLMLKRVGAVAGEARPPSVPGDGPVPAGQVVVLGDAARSYDSKHWGPVDAALVQGVVVRQLSTTSAP